MRRATGLARQQKRAEGEARRTTVKRNAYLSLEDG